MYQFWETPNLHSITNILNHCYQTKDLKATKNLHAHLLKQGLLFISPSLQSKLSLAYAGCHPKNAFSTLINFVKCLNLGNPLAFNSIISNFCQNGSHSLALHGFAVMHTKGVQIDSYALCSVLTSSSCIGDIIFGRGIHAHVEKSGWLTSVYVSCALIDLYAKLLCVKEAAKMFDKMRARNTVCANALLAGYADHKMWMEGLELVRNMSRLKLEYDSLTYSAALRACAGLSAIDLGKQVHGRVIRTVADIKDDVFLQSLLVEIYGKCGLVEKARQVFLMSGFREAGERKRDLVLWTSMLGVYGRNGNFKDVIELFQCMLMEGFKPDGVAFLTVISACDHAGQVNLGIEFFKSMSRDYGLEPSSEHYSCLIDLLCRAGELEKAWKLTDEMPDGGINSFSASMWGALLSACNDCGNVNLGKLAGEKALELDPQNDGIYVLLSNMYAKNNMWSELGRLRELMQGRKLKKDLGCSWIDVTNSS